MSKEDMILIKEGLKLKDSDGTSRVVTLKMRARAYIGDVYIYFKEKAWDKKGYHLMDDEVLIDGVMKYLKTCGYKGPAFGRAESGMQEDKIVILEPCKHFEAWATRKYNFKKLEISKPKSKWEDDSIQFPRLIAELNAAGVFGDKDVTQFLEDSMGLTLKEIKVIVNKAEFQFYKAKGQIV